MNHFSLTKVFLVSHTVACTCVKQGTGQDVQAAWALTVQILHSILSLKCNCHTTATIGNEQNWQLYRCGCYDGYIYSKMAIRSIRKVAVITWWLLL